MKFLKYLSAFLLLCNIPTFFSFAYGPSLGGGLSLLSFLLMLVYPVLRKKVVFLPWLILIGLSYFLISGLQFYSGDAGEFNERFLKYMVLITAGVTVASDLTKKELLFFLLFGASTVVINSIFFADNYGRYSGIYLDPNAAGYICLTGFALTYGLEKSKFKIILQFLFTFAGIITFSRTFIVSWLLINLISLRLSPKNLKVLAVGAGVLILTISTAQVLNFNPIRFRQLMSLVGDEQVSTKEINKDSRTETWATFYGYHLDKPVFGHGYGAFQTNGLNRVGPHNTFLLVLGEAGIIAFIFFIGIYTKLLVKGFRILKEQPHLFMMALVQVLFLLTNHNYFTAYYLVFVSLWLVVESKKYATNEN